MNILDNKLIKMYFRCFKKEGELHQHDYVDECAAQKALHVLQAMQEPIKSGERYLYSDDRGVTWRESNYCALEVIYHPFVLRLPDKFQKKECEYHWIGNSHHPGIFQCAKCNEINSDRNEPIRADKVEKCKHGNEIKRIPLCNRCWGETN